MCINHRTVPLSIFSIPNLTILISFRMRSEDGFLFSRFLNAVWYSCWWVLRIMAFVCDGVGYASKLRKFKEGRSFGGYVEDWENAMGKLPLTRNVVVLFQIMSGEFFMRFVSCKASLAVERTWIRLGNWGFEYWSWRWEIVGVRDQGDGMDSTEYASVWPAWKRGEGLKERDACRVMVMVMVMRGVDYV